MRMAAMLWIRKLSWPLKIFTAVCILFHHGPSVPKRVFVHKHNYTNWWAMYHEYCSFSTNNSVKFLYSLSFQPLFPREYHRISVFTCTVSSFNFTACVSQKQKREFCSTSTFLISVQLHGEWIAKVWQHPAFFLMIRLHFLIKIWYRTMIKWLSFGFQSSDKNSINLQTQCPFIICAARLRLNIRDF